MSIQPSLSPYGLVPGIIYRYVLYGISHIGGILRRFFFTGWMAIALWLLASFILVLGFAFVVSPVTDIPETNNTSVSELVSNITVSGSTNNITVLGSTNNTTVLGSTNNTTVLGSTNNTTVLGSTNNITSSGLTNTTIFEDLGNFTAFATGGIRSAATMMTLESLTAAALLFAFGIIAYYGNKSRKQVVIGTFSSYVGNESIGKFHEGTGPLLTRELHRLRLLYSEVDDRRAIPSLGGRSGELDYAIIADDAGNKVENAISVQEIMEIGPIKFPIGAVAGVLNKFFSGPQIGGSIHRDGDLVILTAFMSGQENKSWRVEGSTVKTPTVRIDMGVQVLPLSTEGRMIHLEEKSDKIVNLDLMVKELACRIFTDLTTGGTTKWRSTYYFTEGLKDYRGCLLSKKDQIRNLKNAERRFLEAISEDNTFDLAWYNLGVIYTELENLEAAEEAFLKAIQMKPDRWQAYYALSLNRFNKLKRRTRDLHLNDKSLADIEEQHIQDIIQPCKQAIALKSKNPHLDILIGDCYRLLARKFTILEQQEEKNKNNEYGKRSTKFFVNASKHLKTAVRNSWHELCRDYQFRLTNDIIKRESDKRNVSSAALLHLARTYYAWNEKTKRKLPILGIDHSYTPLAWILQQAISIDRVNARLYSNLGVVYYTRVLQEEMTNAGIWNYQDASRSFAIATQIDPSKLKYWLFQAISSEKAGWMNKREIAVGKILACPSCMKQYLSGKWKSELKKVLLNQPPEGSRKYLSAILDFQDNHLKREITETLETILASKIDDTDQQTNWLKASYLYNIAKKIDDGNDKKQRCFEKALEFLEYVPEGGAKKWAQGIVYYHLALYTEKSGDYEHAYSCLNKLFPLEIRDREIDLKLIESLLDEEENEKAFDIASNARYKNPLGFGENYIWGKCLFKARDYKQALFSFESALLLEPFDVNTLMAIGACYKKLAYYCKDRDEKNNFWRQAINYYDGARAALSIQKFRVNCDAVKAENEQNEFLISFYLGGLYSAISEYGKSMSNYELATIQAARKSWDHYYSILKCAEVLVYKRDHPTSEEFFSRIFEKFKGTINPDYHSPDSGIPVPNEMDFLLEAVESPLDEIAYAGEIYIRALIGEAFSYAERDARLEKALSDLELAEVELMRMQKELECNEFLIRKEESSEMCEIDAKEKDRITSFLKDKVPILKADILDCKGWVTFKDFHEPNNLKKAITYLQDAISLGPSADHYYHLAYVYTTLARESVEDKDLNLRLAKAHCDHVSDMIPRISLQTSVSELKADIDTLLGIPAQPKSQPKEKTEE